MPDNSNAPHFEPTWESLSRYRCPDWFRDAKLGIFLHWGPTSISAAGTAYSRDMYIEGSEAYNIHLSKYGHPSKVGWKDIIPMWKAENWDPDYVVGVFKKAGARYIVPVASFHDNYDLWDSKHHRWNAVNIGPKKDIVGMWRESALKHGLRFGVSEHLERAYSWFNTNKGQDKDGPFADVPYDGNDPAYEDLYFPPHDDTVWWYPSNPPEWWKQQWFDRITDLIDNCKPDLLYTDGAVPFGDYGLRLMAHFYNSNIRWHAGSLEAVYNMKNIKNHGEYHEGTCVEDLERGALDYLKTDPWQTDTAIGDWFYNENFGYKSARQIITMFVDIVSKNGNLLLDVGLKADGTFAEPELIVLRELADWMSTNSEAIYDSRPWHTYGEGPTAVTGNHFNESEMPYTAHDIRFTTKGDTLYAIALAWPDSRQLTIKSLREAGERVREVTLLGHAGALEFSLGPDGLSIMLPPDRPCRHAWVFRLPGAASR